MGIQIGPKYGEIESTFFLSFFNGRCSFFILFSYNLMEAGRGMTKKEGIERM